MHKNLNDYPDPLPINATEYEQAMAKLALSALDMPVNLQPLLDPKTCDAKHLPFLAQIVGLPVWDEDWPEAKQREAVQKWPFILQNAGDKWAIVEALKIIGVEAEHTWWHEQTPTKMPFTFDVIAWVTENIYEGSLTLIDSKTHGWVKKLIDASKSAHDYFQFKVGSQHNTSLSVHNVLNHRIYVEFFGETFVPEFETNQTIHTHLNNFVFVEFAGATI